MDRSLPNELIDLVDAIDTLDTAYDIFGFTRKIGNCYGADRFSIVALDADNDSISKLGLVNNWDPELLGIYDSENLAKGSPVIAHFEHAHRPLTFAIDTLPQNRDDRSVMLSLSLFKDFDMSKGLSCPLASRSGIKGGITFSGERLKITRADAFNLHLVSNYLFERLASVSDYDGSAHRECPLSEREVDCLRWTALGKTSKEIARLLMLSDHTVTNYLTSSCRKLEASNRVHAVAIAIRQRFMD